MSYSSYVIYVCTKYGWKSKKAHQLSVNGLFYGYLVDLMLPGHKLETKLHHFLGLILLYKFSKIIQKDDDEYEALKKPTGHLLKVEITNIFNNLRILSSLYFPRYNNITQIAFCLSFLTIRPYAFYKSYRLLQYNKKAYKLKYFLDILISLNIYWMLLLVRILKKKITG